MEKLLLRLHPRINQVVWSIAKTDEQARDIEQAAMLEILKYAGKYRGEGSLESWAGEVTYRTGIKILKRSWRWNKHHVVTADPATHHDETSTDAGPEHMLSKRRTFELLAAKMDGIPEERRTAFMLHSIYGHTVNEVSQIMGTTSNTTKYRLKVAVKEMRTIFDENPSLLEAISETKNE